MRFLKTIKNHINWFIRGGYLSGNLPKCYIEFNKDHIWMPVVAEDLTPANVLCVEVRDWLDGKKYHFEMQHLVVGEHGSKIIVYETRFKFFLEEDAVAFKLTWCCQ